MITGRGDIASVLTDREDFNFFACGVSNSAEDRESEFKREIDLLLSQPKDKKLVYFSSMSIYYKDTPYTRHKLYMESLVKSFFESYCIIRIGTITWGINPNTIINNLRSRIKNKQPYEVRNEFRYVIGKSEFLYWISMIPKFNTEMNLNGERINIQTIIDRFCV